MLRQRVILLATALLVIANTSWAQHTAQVGDQRYVKQDSQWYALDPNGVEWEIVPGYVEIKFSSAASASQKESVRRNAGLVRTQRTKNSLGYERYAYDTSRDPVEVLQIIYQNASVEKAILNTRIRFLGSANDTFYAEQWYLPRTGVQSAWDVTTGSSSVTIAVIDVGIDHGHEDLEANMWQNPNEIPGDGIDNDNDFVWFGSPLIDDIYGWNFLDGDNDPRPGPADAHGTAWAGIVSATRNNGKGVAGVAGGENGVGPNLVSLRTLYALEVGDAIEYCWRKGVDVISMSFKADDQGGGIAAQLDSAYAHGVVLVAAAGNSGGLPRPFNQVSFPEA